MPFPFYFFTLRFKILQRTQFFNITHTHTHTQNNAVKLVLSSKESILKLLLGKSVGEGDCRTCHKLPPDDVHQNNARCLSGQNWIWDYFFYPQSDAGTCPATRVFSRRFNQIALIRCYVTTKDV